MADEVEVEVVFDPDEASAAKAADPLEDALTKAMREALKTFATQIRAVAKDMATEFRKIGLNDLSQDMGRIVTDTARAANQTKDWVDGLQAVEQRGRAVADLLQRTGNNPNLAASIQTQLRRITALQEDAERDAVELARNPQLVRAYEARGQDIRTALTQDVRFINRLIEQQTTQEIEEQRARTNAAAQGSRERVALVNAERSRNVVAQQRAGALELEESRRTSRLKLQDERATARQRLAIFQAFTQQVRVLERAIGASFRGAGSILGGLANTVSGATSRIGGIFRRSDAQINAGLVPALNQRTSIFRREMRQTEQVIQSSIVRQSALLQRAEVQASSGVAGLATGRSQIGSLLGGGLAIGGGFALITKLREGFAESVNLNESLNKTRAIFGEASEEILAFADNSVEALFVTRSEALEAAANFGIFGRSAGLAGPELAKFAQDLSLLATDLASFNNTSIADATTAISAALRGESEPIRKYGVLLDAATLEARALAEGITDVERKLTPMERVLAANAEILAQTVVQQGDAARTADDFANASRRAGAASTEFFASIAKFAVPLATLLANGILPVFVELTAFINDEIGPGLRILRDGLIGAATALGGLLGLRVVAEGLQFLSIALRAVLTPMGLLITTVGLVGAAVKILVDRVPEARKAFDDIRESIADRFRQGVELAGRALIRLREIIVETVLPAALELGAAVRDRIVAGFEATVRFVTGTVIPAFQRFNRFVRDELIPSIVETARAFRDRLEPRFVKIREFLDPTIEAFGRFVSQLREAITLATQGDFSALGNALNDVLDFIRPVTDAFADLGGAIADVFTGDFGGALDRIREFGVQGALVAAAASAGIVLAFINPFLGIGAALAGILALALGPRLLEQFRPEVDRFKKFLSGLFDVDFADVAASFLGVVRQLGDVIGSVVSDRRFVTAVAAIGAAAVATGGAFVLGFAEGVRDNLPELIDLLGDLFRTAISEAFKFAISNPAIVLGIFAGAAVLGAFRQAFSRVAAASAGGFVSTFAARTRAAFAGSAFNQGFFGGFAGLEAAARRQAQAESAALSRARVAAQRDLDLLGVPLAPASNAVGQIVAGPGDAVRQFAALEQQLGKTQVAGALMRENVNRAFQSVGEVAGGVGRVIARDFDGGFAQIRSGAGGLATNVGQIFTRLKNDLKAQAGGLGIALGSAIAAGIGSALSGQALGNATTGGGQALGLAGIIASSLFAGAAIGGIPGAVVGSIVGGIGLVTAAFTASGREARLAEERIESYAEALLDIEDRLGLIGFARDTIEGRLLGEGRGVTDIMEAAGLSVRGLAAQFASGTLNADEFRDRLLRLDEATDETRGLRFLNEDAQALLDIVTELLGAEGAVDRVVAVRGEARELDGVTGRVEALRDAAIELQVLPDRIDVLDFNEARLRRIEQTEEAVEDVGTAIEELNRQRTDRINGEIETITEQLGNAREAAQLALESVTTFFTGRQGTSNALLDQLIVGVSGVGSQVGEGIAADFRTALGGSTVRTALDTFGDQLAQIVQQAVTENPQITTDQLSALLDPLRAGIQQAADVDPADMFTQDAANTLIGNINSFLTDTDFDAAVTFANTAQASADELQNQWNALNVQLEADVVFSRGQLIDAMVDALSLTDAEAASVLERADFQKVFESGFDEGGVVAPLIDGIVSGIQGGQAEIDEAVRQLGRNAAAALRGELQISSPSRVFEALGIEIPAGLAEGILAGAPGAHVALREFSETLFERMRALPGTLAEAFASVLTSVPSGILSITESIEGFVSTTFDAIAALEGLAGVDLSKLTVGAPEVDDPTSNAGRTANQFADDLRFRFQGAQPHPPGWIQTEDGTWVPPDFFAPPPSLGVQPALDRPEAAVTAASSDVVAQRIDTINVYETNNARSTARETIMALKTAPFTSTVMVPARRIPADVVA